MFLALSCDQYFVNISYKMDQLLVVQDGRLYGRDPMFAVICKDALLPDGAKNHDIQKNITVPQLEQVKF